MFNHVISKNKCSYLDKKIQFGNIRSRSLVRHNRHTNIIFLYFCTGWKTKKILFGEQEEITLLLLFREKITHSYCLYSTFVSLSIRDTCLKYLQLRTSLKKDGSVDLWHTWWSWLMVASLWNQLLSMMYAIFQEQLPLLSSAMSVTRWQIARNWQQNPQTYSIDPTGYQDTHTA